MAISVAQPALEALRRTGQDPKQLTALALAAAKLVSTHWPGLAGRRRQRRLAEQLARQLDGGRITYGTVVTGEPRTVVWLDDQPHAVFPPPEPSLDLASEVALQRLDRSLLREPPPLRRRPGSARRS